jgi:3-dehydroquinate dehydratase II
MKIYVIDGPNLQKLGEREPEVYGHTPLSDIREKLTEAFPALAFDFFQSNIEGELINMLYEAERAAAGVVMNPGGYSHTSVALADAITTVKIPVVEVHLSNIHGREDYRQRLLTGGRCRGVISGFGPEGYLLACRWLMEHGGLRS